VGVAVRAILSRISPGSVSGAEERRIGRRASLGVIFGGVRADRLVANISRDGATADGIASERGYRGSTAVERDEIHREAGTRPLVSSPITAPG
jgi:hypothetical protein